MTALTAAILLNADNQPTFSQGPKEGFHLEGLLAITTPPRASPGPQDPWTPPDFTSTIRNPQNEGCGHIQPGEAVLQVWTKQSSPIRASSIRHLLPQLPLSGQAHPSSPPTPIRSPNYSPLSQPGRPRTGLAAPETEGESRSHEGRVALSPAAQTPINCKCFGAQNPNNPQCFWENEPVALRGGSAPLPDEAHTKGPQPSLSTQSVNPAKDVSCARTWGRVQHYGPQWAPWAVSGPGVT